MNKRILCFGDSNTWGAIGGTTLRFDDEQRWTGVMQRELGEGYTVINEGYNGRTTTRTDEVEGRLSGIEYFRPCLDSQSPLDLVVLMLGTNDLKVRFGVGAQSIANNSLRQYLDALAITPMMGDRPQLLLVSPIHIDPSYKDNALFADMFGEFGVERSQALAAAYREFAEAEGIAFLDAAAYASACVEDGIHITLEGHQRLGVAIAQKARELIG